MVLGHLDDRVDALSRSRTIDQTTELLVAFTAGLGAEVVAGGESEYEAEAESHGYFVARSDMAVIRKPAGIVGHPIRGSSIGGAVAC